MIGATPLEAPGANETWGVGARRLQRTCSCATPAASGWSLGPALPSGFELATRGPTARRPDDPPRRGRARRHDRAQTQGRARAQARRLLRDRADPGEAEAGEEASGEEPLLGKGEEAVRQRTRAADRAARRSAAGRAGALLVPVSRSGASRIRCCTGTAQAGRSEPIEIPAASATTSACSAIGASSPGNAWLLGAARLGGPYPAGAVALFRRVEEGAATGAGSRWRSNAGAGDGEAHPLTVPLRRR